MDKTRKLRTAVRAMFTRIFTLLDQQLKGEDIDIDDIKSRFVLFKDKTSELEDLNDRMMQLMQESEEISEEDLTKEIEIADEYRLKYQRLKVKLSRIIDASTSGQPQVNESQDRTPVNPTKIRDSSYQR